MKCLASATLGIFKLYAAFYMLIFQAAFAAAAAAASVSVFLFLNASSISNARKQAKHKSKICFTASSFYFYR